MSSKKPGRSHEWAKGLTRAEFAAISAVEGLQLSEESENRLHSLETDPSLTPADRRAAVLEAYTKHSKKR